MEETFKCFLIGYVSAGHTVDREAIDELANLTDEFINWLDPHYCFTENATSTYLEFLDENMSDTNKHFFGNMLFDKCRYVDNLEKWIKHLIKRKVSKGFVGIDYEDKDD